MSEADRAAKAARAKAMLKKRQQKKAAESGGPLSDVASVPSRASTPALSEPAAGDQKHDNIDDVFGMKNTSDTSWLSGLPRAASPPARTATPPSLPSSAKSPPPVALVSAAVQSGPSPKEQELQIELTSLRSEITKLQERAQQMATLEGDLDVVQEKNKKLEALIVQERAQYSALESQLEELRRETSVQLKNHEETISLLVSEKAALTSELHRLDEVEARAQSAEESLEQEREKNADLQSQHQRLHDHISSVTSSLDSLQRKEKQMNDKYREQERQLQLATASAAEARKDADRYQRNLKELEEQIQNDDRLERVEASLKNTQERADELEFQLSKLKHTHSLLRTEKEALESQLSGFKETEAKLESQNSDLLKKQDSTLAELRKITEERDTLASQKASLEQASQGKDAAVAGLHAQLAAAGTEISNQKRQVQTLQNDLRSAQKRVDDSERTQQRLQSEGTNLMRSLDELRPKVVELTEDKVQLSEKLAHFEHELRDRDNVISNLETSLQEAKQEMENLQTEWKTKFSKSEQERSLAATSSSEMEQGFSELRMELDNALDSIRTLETERQSLRQDAQTRLKDLEQLSNASRSQAAEITKLQYELNERRAAQEEAESLIEQFQSEIESLNAEVASKALEVEQLRQNESSSANGSPPSLNEEMLNSLRQQHALDLSASQSQIRALENSVFDAEARAHALQKQVHSLEAQLALARPSSRLGQQRSFSPNHVSRPSSRVQSHSELGRSSFSSSQRPPALSRSIFDQSLTPETLHKRKVSLSMLKARIESEVAAIGPPSRALSPVDSQPDSESLAPTDFAQHHQMKGNQGHHRPQFLDESHVFWCSSCSGELVVL
ncbi:hypothetical protein NP233_g3682 [Leucocoprinus birnbaumii]|uniref:Uncharacterized protein n=1 Tax=Leucocoprinus birnbaumii TaxID=56174 RepID=A0AAD5VXI9_9AGAR|nr:hypothetical protein NP233_g3682 [Leucocoprinus birnbaumii]